MKYTALFLIVVLCLFSFRASAQFSAFEIYGAVGATTSNDEFFAETITGPQFVGGGENFFLQQDGTLTVFTGTRYRTGQAVQFGVEVHYALGARGSFYAGLRLRADLLSYEGDFVMSSLQTSGPIDTVFVNPGNGGGGGGPIIFCPENSANFSDERPDRAFALDIGVPFGYRHRFMNDRVSLRLQGSVNVPIVSQHYTQNLGLDIRQSQGQNCLFLENTTINASSAYRTNAFVFRVGAGVDFSLSHSFTVGFLMQRQLNSTIRSTKSFVADEGNFITVPEIDNYEPLTGSLVARYRLK